MSWATRCGTLSALRLAQGGPPYIPVSTRSVMPMSGGCHAQCCCGQDLPSVRPSAPRSSQIWRECAIVWKMVHIYMHSPLCWPMVSHFRHPRSV